MSEPLDAESLERLRKQHGLISRLGEHFASHLRVARSRGESTSRPCEIDFISADFASNAPGAMRWLDALTECALTQGAPVQPGTLRAVLSRVATAMDLEGLPVSDGLVNAYAVWVVEALAEHHQTHERPTPRVGPGAHVDAIATLAEG